MREPTIDTQPQPDRLLLQLDWRVIRRLDGLLQGDYRTLFYGPGLDFADLRQYQPRDDVRHIDWNVTARLDEPYVRQYVEERDVTAWFLLDVTPSMHFGPAARPKARVQLELVAVLARLLTRSGNRVGAILFDNHATRAIPPRGGRRQVLRLMRELLRPAPVQPGPATNLAPLLRAGLNSARRRGLVFLFSDFICEPGWEKPLAQLNQRHELVAIRLWDQREVSLPDAGLIVVEDAETGEQLLVDTGDPVFRRRFHAAAQQREAALKASLRRAQADLFTASTEEDLVAMLVRMIRLRQRRRR